MNWNVGALGTRDPFLIQRQLLAMMFGGPAAMDRSGPMMDLDRFLRGADPGRMPHAMPTWLGPDMSRRIDAPMDRGRDLGSMGRSTTGAQLDQHLRGALAGQGDAIMRAAQRYGVDPRLLAAIAMHETGNGRSRGVRRNNNPGGLMDRRTNFRTQQRFASMEQGFDAMARNLRRNYLDRGLRSISQIGRKYAPPRANNDPNNLNRHWVPNVNQLYQKLGTQAADGPSGTTSRDSGSTPGNLRASIDSVRNRGARNQMIEGSITVNGNTYRYRSGGHGRGSLPAGEYNVTPHMWSRNTPGMTVGGVGYSFALNDKYDPRVGGTRSLLRIHPDGGSAGTQGCIGIVGNAEVQRRFREDMRAELMRNGGRVRLRVG